MTSDRPRTLIRRLLPRRVTLRARLTIIYGGLFLAAGVVLLGTTYALFNQQLTRSAPEFSSRIWSEDGPPPAGETDPSERDVMVVTEDGDTLTGDDAVSWMASEQNRLQQSATTALITQGGIALLVVGGVAGASGWLVAGRVLGPLHRVTDTAGRIAAAPDADRGLHERISLNGPDDEVKALADTFDTMVERLDRSFDGQRRFVAHASHELRTPLTLSRAMVEMAMHRKNASEDVKRLGEDLLQISTRHERLITGLLLLAASERDLPERHPVDLADVVAQVAAQIAIEARQAGIAVYEETSEAPTLGDALLLERLVHNLVENGIRHNVGDGGWVRVASRTCADQGHSQVQVSNSGPVVPPYEIPALFEPFRRHSADRLGTAKGAGLGLSIVRSVAHAHDGDATAHPREGGGLVVTVTLPLCEDGKATSLLDG